MYNKKVNTNFILFICYTKENILKINHTILTTYLQNLK